MCHAGLVWVGAGTGCGDIRCQTCVGGCGGTQDGRQGRLASPVGCMCYSHYRQDVESGYIKRVWVYKKSMDARCGTVRCHPRELGFFGFRETLGVTTSCALWDLRYGCVELRVLISIRCMHECQNAPRHLLIRHCRRLCCLSRCPPPPPLGLWASLAGWGEL